MFSGGYVVYQSWLFLSYIVMPHYYAWATLSMLFGCACDDGATT